MEQLVPPVFLENEESQSSAQYVLSIGFEEPAHYSNVSRRLNLYILHNGFEVR